MTSQPVPASPPSYAEIQAQTEARQRTLAFYRGRDGFVVELLGDDGESAIALGHVNRARFCNQLRNLWGFEEEWTCVADIEHCWALPALPIVAENDETGWRVSPEITSETEGAVPVTFWSV